MASIHQLANQNLDHMVEKGLWIGLVNASLIMNTRWAENADMKAIPVHQGQDFKINESESAQPKQDPSDPYNIESRTVGDVIYDGVEMKYQKYGYFKMDMATYTGGTEALNNDLAMEFTDTSEAKASFIGDEAALTRDLQSRRALTQAYLGGNSYVTTASGTAVTDLDLKDVNGFLEVVLAGVPTPVSATNPLPVTITNGVLGSVTRNVIGVTKGTRNDEDDTIPGTITLSAAVSQIAVGDNVVSSQAPPHNAPNGKSSAYDIENTDIMNMNLVMDMLATLQSHGVKPHKGGFYQFMGDTVHQAQFWRDPAFQSAYRGLYGNKEIKDGAKIVLGNIVFDFSHQPATSLNENGVMVRRAVVSAEGALVNGYYEKDPAQSYNYTGPSINESYDAVNKIHHYIAKGVGVQGSRAVMTYKAFWGFAARQDSLSKFGQYKDARYKRGIGLLTS